MFTRSESSSTDFAKFVKTFWSSKAWRTWHLAWATSDFGTVSSSTIRLDKSLLKDPDLNVRCVTRRIVGSDCLSLMVSSTALRGSVELLLDSFVVLKNGCGECLCNRAINMLAGDREEVVGVVVDKSLTVIDCFLAQIGMSSALASSRTGWQVFVSNPWSIAAWSSSVLDLLSNGEMALGFATFSSNSIFNSKDWSVVKGPGCRYSSAHVLHRFLVLQGRFGTEMHWNKAESVRPFSHWDGGGIRTCRSAKWRCVWHEYFLM